MFLRPQAVAVNHNLNPRHMHPCTHAPTHPRTHAPTHPRTHYKLLGLLLVLLSIGNLRGQTQCGLEEQPQGNSFLVGCNTYDVTIDEIQNLATITIPLMLHFEDHRSGVAFTCNPDDITNPPAAGPEQSPLYVPYIMYFLMEEVREIYKQELDANNPFAGMDTRIRFEYVNGDICASSTFYEYDGNYNQDPQEPFYPKPPTPSRA